MSSALGSTPKPPPDHHPHLPRMSHHSNNVHGHANNGDHLSEGTPKATHRNLPAIDTDKSASGPSSSGSLRTLFAGVGGSSNVNVATPTAAFGATSRKHSLLSLKDAAPHSGRASPIPSRQNTGPLGHSSYDLTAKAVSSALESSEGSRSTGDDVWQTLCIRVLPLFNGEGLRGFVEDLNALVREHVHRSFVRCQTRSTVTADTATLVTGLLTADLSELLSLGFLTLSSKLAPAPPSPPLDDDKFLARLNEVWSFFLTGLLPHLEAVFWVLRSDERLKAVVGGSGRDREREGRTKSSEGKIDVRRLALINFRDHLILPQIIRVTTLFRELYIDSRPASRQPSQRPGHGASTSSGDTPTRLPPHPSALNPGNAHLSAGPHLQLAPSAQNTPAASLVAANARRRQMVAVLASLLTADERQDAMDHLLRCMRPTSGSEQGNTSPRYSNHDEWPSDEPRLTPSRPSSVPDLPPGTPMSEPDSDGFAPSPLSIIQPSRQRANTMGSLDEEEATMFGAGTSATPTAAAPKGRRRGFLRRLGKGSSKTSSSTVATLKSITGATLGEGGGDEGLLATSPTHLRLRSGSGSKGEESESTAGSQSQSELER